MGVQLLQFLFDIHQFVVERLIHRDLIIDHILAVTKPAMVAFDLVKQVIHRLLEHEEVEAGRLDLLVLLLGG